MHQIHVSNKVISREAPCFIIVEAGVNHVLEKEDLERIGAASSLDVAYKLVDAAKQAGADAIKFQSFTAKGLQFKGTKKPQYQLATSGTDEQLSYYDMIKKLETTEEDQIKIAKYCREKGIIFFSTPYDNQSVDFLDERINVPLYKLASIELQNHLFLRYVASKGKPIILSTGLGDLDAVKEAVSIARHEGFANRLIILQCTSNYPTLAKDINLNVIKTYQKEFPDVLVGLSDHSPSYIASIGAVALGGVVLEKHFTLDKTFVGPDHQASLDPKELFEWVKAVREIEASMGSTKKEVAEVEKRNESMRKFLVMKPQKAGTIIEEDMLLAMRAGSGILPVDMNLRRIIGKKLKDDVAELMPLEWNMIE
ncbi:N-acetylneuraminate synthase family protein [Candidatus Woesearchaeota archaeon]|nr:N-acetylneuraminate synthase family protein [Candidatus Woesearchaeota archaeon]